jgi:hypothetical protein
MLGIGGKRTAPMLEVDVWFFWAFPLDNKPKGLLVVAPNGLDLGGILGISSGLFLDPRLEVYFLS